VEQAIEELKESFAAIEPWERYSAFVVRADGEGIASLGLTGYAAAAAEELDALASGDGEEAAIAGEALVLLYRLARGSG
jgi:hypothetical protein